MQRGSVLVHAVSSWALLTGLVLIGFILLPGTAFATCTGKTSADVATIGCYKPYNTYYACDYIDQTENFDCQWLDSNQTTCGACYPAGDSGCDISSDGSLCSVIYNSNDCAYPGKYPQASSTNPYTGPVTNLLNGYNISNGCSVTPNCNGGAVCGSWSACSGAPANTCYSGNASQSRNCTYTTYNGSSNCIQNSYTQPGSCTISNCSSGFACTSSVCTTSVNVFVQVQNDDGTTTPYQGAYVSDNGGNNFATGANGEVTFTDKATGTLKMTLTVPANYVLWATTPTTTPLSTTIQEALTNSTPNPTLTFTIRPSFTLSGLVYNDFNKDGYFDDADTPFASGSSTFTLSNGPTSRPAITSPTGTFSFGPLLSGTYTVSYTGLPTGYSLTYPLNGPPPSFTVTVGTPGEPSACATGGVHNASCDGWGNITGLDFGISNETSFVQGVCSDMRFDGGYSQVIPASASCSGTSGPYAIMDNPTLCPALSPTPGAGPGILFGGATDPIYGGGLGPSQSGLEVGNSQFPERFHTRIPNVSDTSYNFVLTTLNNLISPPTPLTSICPDLTACVLSEQTPGGVYTTQAADGSVTLSVQNSDGTTQLGPQNYTFLIDNDLTLASNITVQASYGASFITAGDIHVAGNVGETDWTALSPDLMGFYSTDKSFYVDAQNPTNQQCLPSGQPKERKLNVRGTVITDAGGAGGSIVNSRDGCYQDLTCPTVTFTGDPLQLLHAPSPLKPGYTLWQELNP